MNEIKFLDEIKKKKLDGFSNMVDYGNVDSIKVSLNGYYKYFVVMEKLGLSLRDFYEEICLNLRFPDIIKIGIALIKQVR